MVKRGYLCIFQFKVRYIQFKDFDKHTTNNRISYKTDTNKRQTLHLIIYICGSSFPIFVYKTVRKPK